MSRAFAVFQMVVAPMVPLKGLLIGQKKASEQAEAAAGDGSASTERESGDVSSDRLKQLLSLAPIGCIAGLASGMFGIGVRTRTVSNPSAAPCCCNRARLAGLASDDSDRAACPLRCPPQGGVIITPALCLVTEMPYACVLGTTLASMVPPALVSATTHHGLGNVVTSAVLPLVGGAAVGAFGAGQVAVRVPEEPLQWAFAFFITGTGLRKYVSLIGKL